jgi:hypothetical protein
MIRSILPLYYSAQNILLLFSWSPILKNIKRELNQMIAKSNSPPDVYSIAVMTQSLIAQPELHFNFAVI